MSRCGAPGAPAAPRRRCRCVRCATRCKHRRPPQPLPLTPSRPPQVEDLIDAAAGLISVLPELRPLDPKAFNAGYEVWRAIAAVPPGERHRIITDLEPGAIRNLWKASMGR